MRARSSKSGRTSSASAASRIAKSKADGQVSHRYAKTGLGATMRSKKRSK